MRVNMERRCDACLHWRPDPESFPGEPEGQCHRHAPRPMLLAVVEESQPEDELVLWPRTYAGEFCGEWQPPPVKQTFVPCPECARLRAQLDRL